MSSIPRTILVINSMNIPWIYKPNPRETVPWTTVTAVPCHIVPKGLSQTKNTSIRIRSPNEYQR